MFYSDVSESHLAQNENLFLENIILERPFSEDCPFWCGANAPADVLLRSVSQQGDGPEKLLGSALAVGRDVELHLQKAKNSMSTRRFSTLKHPQRDLHL